MFRFATRTQARRQSVDWLVACSLSRFQPDDFPTDTDFEAIRSHRFPGNFQKRHGAACRDHSSSTSARSLRRTCRYGLVAYRNDETDQYRVGYNNYFGEFQTTASLRDYQSEIGGNAKRDRASRQLSQRGPALSDLLLNGGGIAPHRCAAVRARRPRTRGLRWGCLGGALVLRAGTVWTAGLQMAGVP